jgi:hypothetical protein
MEGIGIVQYDPNYNTKDYLRGVFGIKENKATTIPIKPLPKNIDDRTKFEIIDEIRNLSGTIIDIEAFDYLASEAINNISDHSEYRNAQMMAQKYPSLGFTDVCFMDDGIGIPKSLKNSDYFFESDERYIFEALNGLSSDINKDKLRGSGLNSSLRVVSEAFGGEMLIASGTGLIHKNKNGIRIEKLENVTIYGTLISLRIMEKSDRTSVVLYSSHKELEKTTSLYNK